MKEVKINLNIVAKSNIINFTEKDVLAEILKAENLINANSKIRFHFSLDIDANKEICKN